MEVKITTDRIKEKIMPVGFLCWFGGEGTVLPLRGSRWNLIQVHGPFWSDHECKEATEVAQSIREDMASLVLLSVAKC